MPPPQQTRTLLQQSRRIIGVIQGLIALSVLVSFLFYVWDSFSYDYYWRNDYDFITAFFSSLMSAVIIVVVLIQRRVKLTPKVAFHFEIAKFSLASILWIWLMLDSAIVDRSSSYRPLPKSRRMLKGSLAFIVLLLVYLPTLWYAFREKDKNPEEDRSSEVAPSVEPDSERAPLLSNEQ